MVFLSCVGVTLIYYAIAMPTPRVPKNVTFGGQNSQKLTKIVTLLHFDCNAVTFRYESLCTYYEINCIACKLLFLARLWGI